ncbi:MAG: RecQ family ATP-dependent DNA helicase, partial [Candidatus Kryptoniota bacterium]
LTIVITPLISLMRDQVAQINWNGIVATHLDSSLELDEIQNRLYLVRSNKVKLLYVAPERLESKRLVDTLSNIKISLLAIDEAHCISQWGHDFRPHYTRISDFAENIGKPTILALTATATPDVQDDIVAQLKMRSPRVYLIGFSRENLSFKVFVESGKTQTILKHLKTQKGCGIIYAATRKSVDEIHDFLKSNGIKALRYHAGLTENERTNSQMGFLNSDHVMVATNAFGMGINKPNVRYVIHYDIPGTLEAYYQEAGRAGRDGNLAECILLFNKRDLAVQEYFINTLYPIQDEFIKAYTSIFDSLSIAVGSAAPEYLTISTQKISALTKISARTVESVFRILSQAGSIQFVPSVSATAYVRARVDMGTYKRAMERTSSHDTKSILESLLRLHGTVIFSDASPITLDEIAHKSDLNPSTVSRTLSILQRSGILEYKPPSEGISFRMLTAREDADKLHVNFHQLSLLRERSHQRLKKIVDYAESTSCRTNFILDYFGAEEIENGCGNCDNCTIHRSYLTDGQEDSPPPQEIYRNILSLVKETDGKFGRSTYCKFLLGHDGKLPSKEHGPGNELRGKYLGLLKDLPAQAVFAAFDFLLSREYLLKNGFVNPTVSITEEGKDFLRTGYAGVKRKKFIFRKALYKALREERSSLAGELRIPVFNVCADENLIRIANERPRNAKGLAMYFSNPHSSAIEERLLQVCLDFAPAEDIELSESERKIYELFLEKFTAVEIASVLSSSVQSVIETIEHIKDRGCKIDPASLVDKAKFALIKSELLKGKDLVSVHKAVQNAELAEVMLVSRILHG